MKKLFIGLLGLLVLPLAAQTTPIKNAAISGNSTVSGNFTFNNGSFLDLRNASIDFPLNLLYTGNLTVDGNFSLYNIITSFLYVDSENYVKAIPAINGTFLAVASNGTWVAQAYNATTVNTNLAATYQTLNSNLTALAANSSLYQLTTANLTALLGNLTVSGNLAFTNVTNVTAPSGAGLNFNVGNGQRVIFSGTPGSGPYNGSFIFNQNTVLPTLWRQSGTGSAPNLAYFIAGDAASLGIGVMTFGHSGGIFMGIRSDGTGASPSATGGGHTEAEFDGVGYGATGWNLYGAGFRVLSEPGSGQNTDTDYGSGTEVFVVPPGTITPLDVMQWRSNGTVFIGGGPENQAVMNITASSGNFMSLAISRNYAMSGTAGATDLLIDRTETSLGSGPQKYVDFQTNDTTKFALYTNGTVSGNLNFTGTNTNPTPAAGTYTTQTSTTAFALNSELSGNLIIVAPQGMNVTVNGTAGSTTRSDLVLLYTGTTNNSLAYETLQTNGTEPLGGLQEGISRGNFNWAHKMAFEVRVWWDASSANATTRLLIGTGPGALTSTSGVGFLLTGTTLQGIYAANGNETTVSLGTTISTFLPYDLAIYSDGTGNVTYYVNHAAVGNTSSGPTNTISTGPYWWAEIQGNDSTNSTVIFHAPKILTW